MKESNLDFNSDKLSVIDAKSKDDTSLGFEVHEVLLEAVVWTGLVSFAKVSNCENDIRE